MRIHKPLVMIVAIIGCALGISHGVQAQTITLTSSSWIGLSGSALFVGPPLFVVNLSAAANGAFGAATLNPGDSTTVTFSPSQFVTVLNSGVAGSTSSGSNTGTFSFDLAGGSTNISVPIHYTVQDNSNGIGDAMFGLSSGTTSFTVVNGVPYFFSFKLNTNSSTVTDNALPQSPSPITGTLTYLGAAPEPGTAALLSLGILPLGAVIRRRWH